MGECLAAEVQVGNFQVFSLLIPGPALCPETAGFMSKASVETKIGSLFIRSAPSLGNHGALLPSLNSFLLLWKFFHLELAWCAEPNSTEALKCKTQRIGRDTGVVHACNPRTLGG